ncbi:glutathione hydrolase 1 proenzyme-like [Glandiceps talaboti]
MSEQLVTDDQQNASYTPLEDVTEQINVQDTVNTISGARVSTPNSDRTDQAQSQTEGSYVPTGVESEKSPLHLRNSGSEHSSPCGGGDGLKIIIISSITLSVAVTVALALDVVFGPHQVEPHGAVSCNVQLCSQIGVDTLKKGGHAVDAAIATMLCIGLVNAESSGIGGGGFMLIKSGHSFDSIVFRETAPAASTQNMYKNDINLSLKGGLAVAVPGELKGMEMAHNTYGKLPWEDLFKPTIKLAENGFPVYRHTVEAVEQKYDNLTAALKDIYVPNGVKVKKGDKIKRPDLANTLTLISQQGSDVFYNGSITDNIIDTVRAAGGIITKEDFRTYKVITDTALETSYNDFSVHTVPAPSGGPVFLSIISILENYNFTKNDKDDPLTYHRIIEAFKYAYAQKTRLGDPLYVDDVKDLQNSMFSKAAALEIRNKINDNTTYPPDHYGPFFPQSDHGTSHVSVIDNEDNMVSVTTSINTKFGSTVMTPDGILLNNEMNDFNWPGKYKDYQDAGIPVSTANYIKGGKRPQSSSAPVIAYDKSEPCQPRFAIGGINGTRITTGVVQTFINLLSLGLKTLKNAIDEPRLHHQLIPNEVEVEDGISNQIISGLRSRGHTVTKVEPLSVVVGVFKAKDKVSASGDSRLLPQSEAVVY